MLEELADPGWKDVNICLLRGRLGRAPELRITSAGGRMANLSIATSEKWRDNASNTTRERTQWHRLVIFNGELVAFAETLHTGERIEVRGQLQTREWIDHAGQKRHTTEVFLGRWNSELRRVREDGSAAAARAPRPTAPEDAAADIPF